MSYLEKLFENCESFNLFTKNQGIGIHEIKEFNKGLMEITEFNPVTLRFIEVLAENKRLMYISEVAKKF